MARIEDICLTLDQSKELEIKKTDTIFSYVGCITSWDGKEIDEPKYRLMESKKSLAVQGSEKFDTIPTLTNSEMLLMLPQRYNDSNLQVIHTGTAWIIAYYGMETHNILLRDGLFEMIKKLIYCG